MADGTLADRVTQVVAYNTGGPQPEAIDADRIKAILCSGGGADPDRVEAVLQTLTTQGDLESTPDGYRVSEDG
ncbi:MAG: hypothetical protein ABEI31_00605 [Halodesulfurarchaeum sp.]